MKDERAREMTTERRGLARNKERQKIKRKSRRCTECENWIRKKRFNKTRPKEQSKVIKRLRRVSHERRFHVGRVHTGVSKR